MENKAPLKKGTLKLASRASMVVLALACLTTAWIVYDHYRKVPVYDADHEKRMKKLDELVASSEDLLAHGQKQNEEFKERVAKAQKRLAAAKARQAAAKEAEVK